MKRIGELLTKHRSLFLLTLMLTTLALSSVANQRRLSQADTAVSLPVMSVPRSEAINVYAQERDDAYLADVAALQFISTDSSLDAATRQDAAERLTEMTRSREAQTAIETALSQSSLSPCAVVVTGSSVTVITHRTDVTEEESALVLSLALAHADVPPASVRIMTAD